MYIHKNMSGTHDYYTITVSQTTSVMAHCV